MRNYWQVLQHHVKRDLIQTRIINSRAEDVKHLERPNKNVNFRNLFSLQTTQYNLNLQIASKRRNAKMSRERSTERSGREKRNTLVYLHAWTDDVPPNPPICQTAPYSYGRVKD